MEITSIFWVLGVLSFFLPITLLILQRKERGMARGHRDASVEERLRAQTEHREQRRPAA